TMIRFLIRAIGFFILAAAFVAVLYDGTKTIAAGDITITSAEQLWMQVFPTGPQTFQAFIARNAPEWASASVLGPVLRAPAALVLAVIGALLMLIGRKRKPLIGYAR